MLFEAILEDALEIMNQVLGDGLEVESKALFQIGQLFLQFSQILLRDRPFFILGHAGKSGANAKSRQKPPGVAQSPNCP